MCKMTAMTEVHGENFITRLTPGKINRLISISTRVRLDISVVSMEEFHGARDRKALNTINIGLPTIVTVIREDSFFDFVFSPVKI